MAPSDHLIEEAPLLDALREAAGRLHRAGLRMRLEGWGVVTGSDPAPGTALEPGSIVTVRAGSGS